MRARTKLLISFFITVIDSSLEYQGNLPVKTMTFRV
nr:MAG TPA: hypothetical protein [Caudoviricetes sp.]